MIGCSQGGQQNKLEIESEYLVDQNIDLVLFSSFNEFYSSIYFLDGTQPGVEDTVQFYYEIDDSLEKTGIRTIRVKEFYDQNKNNSELLRHLVYRISRAKKVNDLKE